MFFFIQPPVHNLLRITFLTAGVLERLVPWQSPITSVAFPAPTAHPHHCHPHISCPRHAHTHPHSLVSQSSKFLTPAFYKLRWLCSCYSSALPIYLLFSTWENPSYSPTGSINATFSVEPSPLLQERLCLSLFFWLSEHSVYVLGSTLKTFRHSSLSI